MEHPYHGIERNEEMPEHEIIKALMENTTAFGYMLPEKQNKAREIGMDQFLWLCAGGWKKDTKQFPTTDDFTDMYTYRLRPDYSQPEPEVVKCEVYPGKSGHLSYSKGDTFDARLIYFAVSDPDFIGFVYEDGTVANMPRLYRSGNVKSAYNYSISEAALPKNEVLTPTHILFRGKK